MLFRFWLRRAKAFVLAISERRFVFAVSWLDCRMVWSSFALTRLATSCRSVVFGVVESMSDIRFGIMVTFEHT